MTMLSDDDKPRASLHNEQQPIDTCSSDRAIAQYYELVRKAKARISGEYDLRYGPTNSERLDIYPIAGYPDTPLFAFILGSFWAGGRYFHSLRELDAPVMAAHFVQRDVSVAAIRHTNLTDCTLPEIIREVRTAIAFLYNKASEFGIYRNKIIVGGGRLGAFLAACLLQDGWQSRYELPDNVVKGGCLVGGFYDLDRLEHLEDSRMAGESRLCMSSDQSYEFSPINNLAAEDAEVLLSVASAETSEMKQQTLALFERYQSDDNGQGIRKMGGKLRPYPRVGVAAELLEAHVHDHSELIAHLCDPDSILFRKTLRLAQRV